MTSYDVITRHNSSYDVITRHHRSYDVICRHMMSYDGLFLYWLILFYYEICIVDHVFVLWSFSKLKGYPAYPQHWACSFCLTMIDWRLWRSCNALLKEKSRHRVLSIKSDTLHKQINFHCIMTCVFLEIQTIFKTKLIFRTQNANVWCIPC